MISRTIRKPVASLWRSGVEGGRKSEPHSWDRWKLPPLRILYNPDAGPLGSITGSSGKGANQSSTHSATLPYISKRPQGFFRKEPTGAIISKPSLPIRLLQLAYFERSFGSSPK